MEKILEILKNNPEVEVRFSYDRTARTLRIGTKAVCKDGLRYDSNYYIFDKEIELSKFPLVEHEVKRECEKMADAIRTRDSMLQGATDDR